MENMEKISLSREDILAFTSTHSDFSGLDLSRISSILIIQIIQLHHSRKINTFCILNEIRALEGLPHQKITKNPDSFNHPPLKGLMKSHFIDSHFLIKNLNNFLGIYKGGNKNLDKSIDKALKENKSGYLDDETINKLVHEVTFEAYNEKCRNKNLTGEWVIYKKYQNRNYYLTLGTHNEGDQNIFDRVFLAYDFDFPFLKENQIYLSSDRN